MPEEPLEGRSGRSSDRALVLTFATLILLTPPILGIFDMPVFIFGVPLLHVYSFTIWLAAIACGCWLSHRIGSERWPTGEARETRPGGD
jgi:hypothetical protein